MKTLLFALLFLTSCNLETRTDSSLNTLETSKETYSENIEVELISEVYSDFNKIDIEELIEQDTNGRNSYFLTYKNGNLTLCDFEPLYNPLFSLEEDELRKYLGNYVVKTDKSENYFYNTYYDNTPSSINIITYIDETGKEVAKDLGEGNLSDSSVILPNNIKIGMDKDEFLSKFFIYDKVKIKDLKQVAVCQDPRGETYTKYKFKDDKLQEIEFGDVDKNMDSEEKVVERKQRNESEIKEKDSVFIIKFDKLQLRFFSKDIGSKQKEFEKVYQDTIIVNAGLGEGFEEKEFEIISKHPSIEKIEVLQRYQTSLGISEEGAHLDLLNWKHFNSEWETLHIDNDTFVSKKYSSEQAQRFPKVNTKQILQAVIAEYGDEQNKFVRQAKKCQNENDYPCSVMINQYRFKIIITEKDGNVTNYFILINLPMGC